MTNKLTTKTAAIQVLEEAREPMSIMEICEGAIKLGWSSKGKTPEATIGASLYTNADDGGPFVLIEPGVFGLRKYKKRYKQNIFYVLVNPAMPGYLKVGTASNLVERLRSLSNPTGIPRPFKVLYAAKTKKAPILEKTILRMLNKSRVGKTDFLEGINLEQNIRPLIDSHAKEIEKVIVDKDKGIDLLDEYEKKPSTKVSVSPKFVNETKKFSKFSVLGIKPGELLFLKGDRSITCEVSDDDVHVWYQGQKMFLSKAATKAKRKHRTISGTRYWEYKGRSIRNILDRFPLKTSITSQSAKTKPKKTGYTGPFNFREVNIPRGTTLTLKGSSFITCEVYDDTQVKYRGEVMSVSRAATLAKESSTALAGTLYWEHRGRTLHAIQDEMGPKPSVASSPKKTKYTGPFNFREIGIPRGAILAFIKDASVTCEVHNDTQVRFRGNVMSLSKAAGLALGFERERWGPKFWQYEGELLFSRRERIRQTK